MPSDGKERVEIMKKFKKMFAVLAASALVAAMPLTVLADSTVNITLKRDASYNKDDVKTEYTYTAYKIFDANADAGISNTQDNKTPTSKNPQVAYTIDKDSDWVSVLGTFEGNVFKPAVNQVWIKLTKAADGENYIVEATDQLKDEGDAKAFADWLFANKGNITGETLKIGDNSVDKGYYLIESNLGSNLILATTDMDLVEKNTYPSATKQLTNSTDDHAQIGKDINYTATVIVPSGANQEIVVTDTMTQGLTLNVNSLKIDDDGKNEITTDSSDSNADKKIVYTYTHNDRGFTVTIDEDNVKELVKDEKQHKLTFTYSAKLNKDAVAGTSDNNKLNLKYGNNFESNTNQVDTSTQKFEVRKYDGADETKANLAGARFNLLDGEGQPVKLIKVNDTTYRVADATETAEKSTTVTVDYFETVASDNTVITGVDGDVQYWLKEIKAPDGYNMLDHEEPVTPGTTNNIVAEVENTKGVRLPSTGGIGTTVFAVAGLVIMAGAAAVLVIKKRS